MSRKKTLVRNLLFAALILAAGLYCTGCCTMSVIQNLGTTRTEFSEYRYEMSPGRDEIVLTGKRKISKATGSFSFGAARDVFITGNHYRVAPSIGAFDPQITGEVPGLTVSENEITPFLVPPVESRVLRFGNNQNNIQKQLCPTGTP